MHAPAGDVRRLSDRRLAWLFLAALVVWAAGIGLRDPWPADEPRFVLNALEMIETGQWLIPHRGGEAYPDKPPIFMWAIAASVLATGSVRLGFLLPSLLAALGTLWLVVDLVRRLRGQRAAMLAGLALVCTVQFALQAKTAQIDMLVTFWITLGAYGLMRHALLGPARGWWYLACAAMGAGVITKGVGFLPLLMVPAWVLLARKGRANPLRPADALGGLLTFLSVIALWVLPMTIYTTASHDPTLLAYRDNILLRQTAERYVSGLGHFKPWHYYLLEVIPWAWLPLWLVFPWAVPHWWRRCRRGDAGTIVPLSGAVLILLFFTLSPAKRGVYLLPAIPLLVVALSPLLAGLLARRGPNGLATGLLVALGGSLGIAGLLGWAGFEPLVALADKHDASPWLWWTLLGVGMLAGLAGLGPRRGLMALSAWLALLFTTFGLLSWPDMNGSRSPRDLMQQVASITGPGAWLAVHDFGEEFLLQTRQPTVHFGYHSNDGAEVLRAFHWLKQAPEQRWLLIAREHRERVACMDASAAYDLGFQNSQHWWLFPGSAASSCVGNPQATDVFVVPTSLRDSPYL